MKTCEEPKWSTEKASKRSSDHWISPGDLGWVIMVHGEVYAAEFGGDSSFEALVTRIVADYAADHDPSREAAWIANVDGRRVGCIFCVGGGDPEGTTAKLRILLVHPDGRGHRLGGQLVDTCMEFARAATASASTSSARHTPSI